jgi:sensor c-di-GMP phosphodiesterase-like protein
VEVGNGLSSIRTDCGFFCRKVIFISSGQTECTHIGWNREMRGHLVLQVLTFISIPYILLAKRNLFLVYAAIGGLTCGLFGFLFSLLYQRSRGMAQQLRRAIRKDKLRLVYQPIVELATGRIVGAEALVRWTNESGIDVGPNVFVKLAEERGFVGSITRFVLRQAVSDFHETLRTHPTFRLSINVAAADLADPTFLPALDRAIELAGVPANRLVIEITESSTARSPIAIKTIRSLRQRGHAVHIDDFGTGYSNLAYLNDLSVDAIKIDKTFVQAIGTDSVIFAILPQILSIAEALKLEVIVEGVETFLQARYFVDMGKPVLAQGWLFGRPVSAEALQRLLTEDPQEIADLQRKKKPILCMPSAVIDGSS